jgi:group I intron endonuclease
LRYNCGIYKIENIVTGDFYIGQSINLKNRRYQHFYELKKNKHKNKYLQNSFNKYGKENFKFFILLYCDINNLTFYEQLLVDNLNPAFNLCLECVHHIIGKHKPQSLIKIQQLNKKNNKSNKIIWYKTDYDFEDALYGGEICLHNESLKNIINGGIPKILKNNSYIWNSKNLNNIDRKIEYFIEILHFYFYLFKKDNKNFTKEMEKVIKRDYTTNHLRNSLKRHFERTYGNSYPQSEIIKINKILKNIVIKIDKYKVLIYVKKKKINHLYILFI